MPVPPGEDARFSVNPELGLYYCFGCQESGDAITFVREIEHLDFVDAVERLAARAGITLRYDDKRCRKDRQRKSRLSEAVGAAIDFYHRDPARAAGRRPRARGYLRSRGLRRRRGASVRARVVARRLGRAEPSPPRAEVLARRHHRRRPRVREQGQQAAGPVPGAADVPDLRPRGEPVGFGGRALGADGPKYKNSPETPIYQKSRLLYGLNWAKAEIVARGEVVICEGYTDVMAFALAGCPERGRDVRHRARRRPRPDAEEPRPQGRARLRRRHRRPGRGGEVVPVGAAVRDRGAGRRPAAGRDPGDVWRDDPDAAREGGRGRAAVPAVPARPRARAARTSPRSRDGRARPRRGARCCASTRTSSCATSTSRPRRERSTSTTRWFKEAIAAAGAASASRRPRRRDRDGRRAGAAGAPGGRSRPREVDVLRWAIHEPELVADWLDASLFVDPVARGGVRAARRARPSCTTRSATSEGRVAGAARAARGRGAARPTTSPRRSAPGWW